MTSTPRSPRRRVIAYALLAGTALGGFAMGDAYVAHAQSPASVVEPKPGAIQPTLGSHLPDFVSLVKEVKPAVVSITSKMRAGEEDEEGQGGQAPGGFGHGQQLPFPFPFPFAQQQQQQEQQEQQQQQ